MTRDPGRNPPAAIASPMTQVQLDQLEDELKLTPQQRPLWNAFADKVAKLMDDVSRARQPGAAQPENALAQLDRLTDAARNRLAALEDIAEAGKRLYPQLTSEQKEIADRRLAMLVAPAIGDARPTAPGGRPPTRP